MSDRLQNNLEAVFSILPEDLAEEARRKTLQSFLDNRDLSKNELKWANFDNSGGFIGGGASDIGGFSVRVINQPKEDDQIRRLVELAKNNGAMAGLMERSPSQKCIFWFLPLVEQDSMHSHRPKLRGLVVPEILFLEVIDLFNPGRKLTEAERHLIYQITSGLTVRQAAEEDQLAFETKRAQLKSVCAKMQCGGQSDLIRLVLGQMTYLLSVSDVKQTHSELLQRFASNFLSNDTRIFLQRLPNGRSLQILEVGPTEGAPVLLIHGMLWPLIFTGSFDSLYKHNFRLIVPLRSGYLGQFSSSDIYGRSNMIEESLADIALFQSLFLGKAVPVIGHSYGGPIAIKYTADNPELVEKLIIVSVNAGGQNEINKNFIGRFFGGLQSLSNKRGTFRYLTWQFKRYYADEKTVGRILRRMFQGNEQDIRVLDGSGSERPAYPWFVELYQKSIPGIADDFSFVMGNWQDDLKTIDQGIMFIHGDADPVVDLLVIKKYVSLCQSARLITIPQAGHHLFRTHSDEMWKLISNSV